MFITIVEFDYFIKYVTVLVYLRLLDLLSLIFTLFSCCERSGVWSDFSLVVFLSLFQFKLLLLLVFRCCSGCEWMVLLCVRNYV